MTLKHILGQPSYIEGIGNIFPIKVKDWEDFDKASYALQITKKHFQIDDEDNYKLLDLLIFGIQDVNVIDMLETLFKLVLRNKDIKFFATEDKYAFIIDESNYIYSDNFDQLRKTIMEQNLIFEAKVYKNKLMQEWAEKVIKAKAKNSANITNEDIISTIAISTGRDYEQISNMTIYQLKSEFNRICQIKDYDAHMILYANPYADLSKMKIKHFAEKIDMFRNPYDDLFVNKNKLNSLNKAIGGDG